jgi:hypothetical protein
VTRLGRWLLHIVERVIGRYYEGPTPPRHVREEVRLFRVVHPHATADQWEEFAAMMAENCYRSGFVRGYEWQERDWPGPEVEPEQLAEATAHDWSLAESDPDLAALLESGVNPEDPLAGVDADARARLYDAMGMIGETHRVVDTED